MTIAFYALVGQVMGEAMEKKQKELVASEVHTWEHRTNQIRGNLLRHIHTLRRRLELEQELHPHE